MILGYRQKIDPASGKKVYDANGYPVRTDVYEVLGNGIAKLTGGLSNSFPGNNSDLTPLLTSKPAVISIQDQKLTLPAGDCISRHLNTAKEACRLKESFRQEPTQTENLYMNPFSKTLNQQQTADYWGNLAYRARKTSYMMLHLSS